MAHDSWGPGWPNCQTDKLVTVTENGLRLPVRKEIAPLVAGLVKELADARGKPFRADWSWGFACRAIAGTSIPSNHSYGLSIDLDAPENPYLTAASHQAPHPLRKTYPNGRVLRSTMPKDTEAIAKKWGFRWGGTYSTKPDPMHFEFLGSVTDAAALRKKHSTPDIVIVARKKRTVKGWRKAREIARRLRRRGFDVVLRKS